MLKDKKWKKVYLAKSKHKKVCMAMLFFEQVVIKIVSLTKECIKMDIS